MNGRFSAMLLITSLWCSVPARAESARAEIEAGLEHLWPVHADRQLTATSLDVLWGRRL